VVAQWHEDISRDDSIDLELRALFAAADEDAATGGPDLVRRIFPTVGVIDGSGFVFIGDDEIARRADALIGGREEGAGL
jgi:proteasome beta subunit